MKLEDVAVHLELLWGGECHGRASSVQLSPVVGSARAQEAFPPSEGSSDRRWAELGEPGSTAGIPGAVSAPLSSHKRIQIAMEFCAVSAWIRNLLIFRGKFTYKLSLCTCDTDARISYFKMQGVDMLLL